MLRHAKNSETCTFCGGYIGSDLPMRQGVGNIKRKRKDGAGFGEEEWWWEWNEAVRAKGLAFIISEPTRIRNSDTTSEHCRWRWRYKGHPSGYFSSSILWGMEFSSLKYYLKSLSYVTTKAKAACQAFLVSSAPPRRRTQHPVLYHQLIKGREESNPPGFWFLFFSFLHSTLGSF